MPTRRPIDPADFALPADLQRSLADSVRSVVRWGQEHSEAEERLAALQAGLVAVEEQRERILEARLDALADVREGGASYATIARLTGLTRGRVPQLLRRAAQQSVTDS